MTTRRALGRQRDVNQNVSETETNRVTLAARTRQANEKKRKAVLAYGITLPKSVFGNPINPTLSGHAGRFK